MMKREYRSIWKEREREEKRRRASAIEKAKFVVKVLKNKYYVKEAILFGSLISRPDFLWSGTDIDLMVKGLNNKKYFKILAEISVLAQPFQVDLIPFEKANPTIKKYALRNGLRLE
jgi:predicted nucleotidyltransferase